MIVTNAVREIARAGSRDEVFELIRAYYREHGFNALSYMTPSVHHPGQAEITHFGYPAAWEEKYFDGGYALVDPFPSFAVRMGRPLRLSRLGEEMTLTAEHRHYLEEARSHGMTDGYILPTFGPRQHMALFSVGQVDDPAVLDDADLEILQFIAQTAHLRLDQLAAGEVLRPRLAPREVVILHWIAQGKSNEAIAGILGIGRPTVATHIKRIFHKLDVADRASAAVRGIKFGIINA